MSRSSALPPALVGDKRRLSSSARAEIRGLTGARPIAFVLQALCAWAVIFGTIAAATKIDSLWFTMFALIVISTRINILALLVHEQVHYLGIKGKHGDSAANLLIAYPLLGISVEDYARVHLAHHRYYFTDKDPDHLRKAGTDWTFPMSYLHLAKLLLSDIVGLTFVRFLRGKRSETTHLFRRTHPSPRWLRPLFLLGIAALLTWSGTWSLFFLYWVLPLLTVFQVIVRLGAVCEHVYNLPGADVIESSPIIIQPWWEKILLPNLNFTFHIYHHFYPGVAWANLPKVHEIFRRENLVNEQNVFRGHGAYLRYLQTRETKMEATSVGSSFAEVTQSK
jgi:fatty acid desaturase